jgi:hypothetical protein
MSRFRMHTYTRAAAPLPGDGPSIPLAAKTYREAANEADRIWEEGRFAAIAPKGYCLVDTETTGVFHKRANA